MSSYSYDKNKLFKAPISGIIIFIIGFAISIWIPNLITIEHFIKKADYYKNNIKQYTCMSIEKQNNIGYTWLKKVIENLNIYFNFGLVKRKTICDAFELMPLEIFGLKFNLIKLYMIVLGSSSTLLLIKIISNYTINSVILNTIHSNIKTTPINIENNKPIVNTTTTTIYMILFYLLNVLIISIPIIFIYTCIGLKFFDLSNWKTIWDNFITFPIKTPDMNSITNIKKFFKNVEYFFKKVGYYLQKTGMIFKLLTRIIIVITVFILPLIYIFCSLNLLSIPFMNDFILSADNTCKKYLSDFFELKDKMYVEHIYENKDNVFINMGLWISIFIVLFLIHYNIVNIIKSNNNTLLYLMIFVSVLIFSFYIIYKNYTYNNQEIFDTNNNLTKQMSSSSVNNILQAIVKYNYPCMI